MVEITDRKSLEAWLKTRPREDAVLIAARAAMRVLPVLVTVLDRRADDNRRTIVLPVCRAMNVASFAGTWPRPLTGVAAHAAAQAADAAFAADAQLVAAAGAVGVAYAAADAAAAVHAADAAHVGTAATAYAAAAASDDSAAVEADANGLMRGWFHARLAAEPLWHGDPPDWAVKNWVDLKAHLLEADEGWEVWIDWYERRLYGSEPVEVVERCYIDGDEDFWSQHPATVNAEIARRLAALDHPDTDRQLEATRPYAESDFAHRADGDAMVPVPFPEDAAPVEDPYRMRDRADQLSALADLAKDLAYDLKADRPQVPATLGRDLGRYAREAAVPAEEVRPRRLVSLAVGVRTSLTDEDIRHGLGNYLLAKVEEFAVQHNALVAGYYAALLERATAIAAHELPPATTPEQLEAGLAEAGDLLVSPEWRVMPTPPAEYVDPISETVAEQRALRLRLDFETVEAVRASGARQMHETHLVAISTASRLITRTVDAASGRRGTAVSNTLTISTTALDLVARLLRLLGLL